jgi:hypothetical protein
MQSYSFGISREAYKKVYLKHNPNRDPNLPGPGVYDVTQKAGQATSKFTMLGKTFYNPS